MKNLLYIPFSNSNKCMSFHQLLQTMCHPRPTLTGRRVENSRYPPAQQQQRGNPKLRGSLKNSTNFTRSQWMKYPHDIRIDWQHTFGGNFKLQFIMNKVSNSQLITSSLRGVREYCFWVCLSVCLSKCVTRSDWLDFYTQGVLYPLLGSPLIWSGSGSGSGLKEFIYSSPLGDMTQYSIIVHHDVKCALWWHMCEGLSSLIALLNCIMFCFTYVKEETKSGETNGRPEWWKQGRFRGGYMYEEFTTKCKLFLIRFNKIAIQGTP